MHPKDTSAVIFSYDETAQLEQAVSTALSSEIGQLIVACEGDIRQKEALDRVTDPRLVVSYRSHREGKASAYNRILPLLKDWSVVFLLSADVRAEPGVYASLLPHFKETHVGVAVPKVEPCNVDTFPTRVASVLWDIHDVQLHLFSNDSKYVHGGEFLAIRGGLLEPFPPNLVNDDAYLCVRAIQRGYALRYVRDTRVENRMPLSIRELLRQRRRVNFGHRQLSGIGCRPSVLTNMFFDDMRSAMLVLFRTIREHPRDVVYLPLLVLEELVAIFSSRMDFARHVDHSRWAMVGRSGSGEPPNTTFSNESHRAEFLASHFVESGP